MLHPHVAEVTARLATGLGDQLAGVEEPEEALLEVLGAAHATAVKLWRRAQRGDQRRGGQTPTEPRSQSLTVVMMAFHVEVKTSVLL